MVQQENLVVDLVYRLLYCLMSTVYCYRTTSFFEHATFQPVDTSRVACLYTSRNSALVALLSSSYFLVNDALSRMVLNQSDRVEDSSEEVDHQRLIRGEQLLSSRTL